LCAAPPVIGIELFSGKPFSRLGRPLAKIRSCAGIGTTNAVDRSSDDKGIDIIETTPTPLLPDTTRSRRQNHVFTFVNRTASRLGDVG
jgi:hypothetical protein